MVTDKKLATWEDAVNLLKNQPNNDALVKACFYDDPLIFAAERYYKCTEWDALRAYMPKVGRVLDIGSGRGISAYAFAKDGWQVNALEPDSSDLVGAGAIRKLAEQSQLNIKVEQTWGEQLPYADSTFDLVYGRQVLHHARDLKKLCKEAARVLKPNGMFIFTREHVISKQEDLNIFLQTHPLHKLYGGEYAYLLQDYKNAIQESGIKLNAVLNPMQSNINLYPESIQDVKQRIAVKFKMPSSLIPNLVISMYGALSNSPGRLYSFVGKKNA
jgi:ubiquinone/menaquinone biosynthesis C-methylase UbiE